MEFLPILLLIIIIILVLNQSGNITRQISQLQDEINSLRRQLVKFTADKKEDLPAKFTEKPQPAITKKEIIIPPVKVPDPIPVPLIAEPKKEIPPTIELVNETIATPVTPKGKPQPPSFSERHPDMEKFIGENLVSKIGIAILVLAIGFFVKYAIDKNWIGPVGRVAIGILCGGILVAFAHRLRNIYKGFSSVLAGGSLAVFYFTITLAYQQFQLFSQPVAFTIMIVITAFAVILSLLYNRQELAIISLVGGFIAPFLVSDGSGNYKVLFTYLIILNSGLLVIAYHKAWRLLNILSFIFTVIIFGGWLFWETDEATAVMGRNGFLFATVFYIIFFVANIAHNVKEKKKFLALDFGILLVNTCLYFSVGLLCLNVMDAGNMKGVYSASMGVFNLVASYFLFRKQRADINILYLLIGITLTFISITAPLQLHGNYITLFWASEAVLLYWLSIKSGIGIIRYSSILVWIAMIISLAMDWVQLYLLNDSALVIIANKGFITTVFSSIATYLLFILSNDQPGNNENNDAFPVPRKNFFRISAFLLLFIAGALEISYQFNHYYPNSSFDVMYLLLYTVTYAIILHTVSQIKERSKTRPLAIIGLFTLCLGFYLLSLVKIFSIQYYMLLLRQFGMHFWAHWITAILVALMIYRLTRLLQENKKAFKKNYDISIWLLCAIIVVFLSAEIHLLVNSIFYTPFDPLQEIHRVYIKSGLPILWGLCSFAFMWLGMHYKFRTLRIISLSLFLLTLLKLFIFDIRNIPVGGKIAAFFCLGVLLLVVSFMYQRLKKIIIEDEEKLA